MASRSPICRCGTTLTIPPGIDKLICPVCGARVRIRRETGPSATGRFPGEAAWPGGVILFDCPCGQKLKLDASHAAKSARCPSCRQIVPVPELPHDAPTGEMPAADRAILENWIAQHTADALAEKGSNSPDPQVISTGSTALAASSCDPRARRFDHHDGSLEMRIDPDLMGTLADRPPPPSNSEGSPTTAPPLVPFRSASSQAGAEFLPTQLDPDREALDAAALLAASRIPETGLGGGLRVCGHCRRPLHIAATVCRHCGATVTQS